ncbi:MAG: TIR domain-containing protein [Rubrivivax sp.]|nr:TIR domain-containing protein [Rubrivivax sp.]
MAKLFISYARRDGAELAHRLLKDLAENGHDPWLDKRQIEPGEAWARAIEEEVGRSDALLALLTAGAFESSICRGEQLRAVRLHKPILPLLAQADADRPVYLEAAHYLDFTDKQAYGVRLAELLGAIASGHGLLLSALPPYRQRQIATSADLGAELMMRAGGPADWQDLLTLARLSFSRFSEALAPAGTLLGQYEADLHVERAEVQAELKRFAAGPALGLVLIGEPGVGKTHLLARWCHSRLAQGDAVLAYPGARLDAARLPVEIAHDLGFEYGSELQAAWTRLEGIAADAQRTLWIAIDGLDDCRSGPDAARQLMLAIDALMARLPGHAIRLLVSSAAATWERMSTRRGPLKLAWGRYHATEQRNTVLELDRFTLDEARRAWSLHAARLSLPQAWVEFSPVLQARLTDPSMLRLLAEALVSFQARGADLDFDTIAFQHYFAQRIGGDAGRDCLAALAAKMLTRRQAALPLGALAADTHFERSFDADRLPIGTLAELIDRGVLTEMPGDGIDDASLRFTYPQIGALAMVRAMLPAASPGTPLNTKGKVDAGAVRGIVQRLLAAADDLPLAWEAAISFVASRADDAVICDLAGDADPELRELAMQSVVRQHGIDPAHARNRLDLMIHRPSAEPKRTAVRAALHIGPAMRDWLIKVVSGSDEVKHAVRDTLYFIWSGFSQPGGLNRTNALYFIWRRAPDFTHELLDELVSRIGLFSIFKAGHTFAFVLDVMITIYINHCERQQVIEHTAMLFRRIAVEKLHLDRIALPDRVEKMVLGVVSSVLAERVLGWVLLDESNKPEAFFSRSGDRALLAQAAPWLDPATQVDEARALLQRMFTSTTPVVRGAAALVVAVHALADLTKAEGVIQGLFDSLDARGRGWLLAGLAVLIPDTPEQWVPMLEELTERLIDEGAAAGASGTPPGPPPILPFFDALYVPLGLAYGKRGDGMPMFEPLLQDAASRPQEACRLVTALGIVGFYHPQPALDLLCPHLAALLSDAALAPATVAALATIRTLHFEAVDRALAAAGTADARRRDIVAGGQPVRVQQFMALLGYHNNAVHFCVEYPIMRRGLAMHALQLLATATGPREFVSAYAQRAIHMAREARFDLRRWTAPDGVGAEAHSDAAAA